MLWDTLSNADDQWHLCLNGLLNTGRSERWRDEDGTGIGASLFPAVGDIGENGETKVLLASLLGVGTALCCEYVQLPSSCSHVKFISTYNNVGAVLDGLAGVESTLLAGETLEQDLGVGVDSQVVASGSISAQGGGRVGAGEGWRRGAKSTR